MIVCIFETPKEKKKYASTFVCDAPHHFQVKEKEMQTICDNRKKGNTNAYLEEFTVVFSLCIRDFKSTFVFLQSEFDLQSKGKISYV